MILSLLLYKKIRGVRIGKEGKLSLFTHDMTHLFMRINGKINTINKSLGSIL